MKEKWCSGGGREINLQSFLFVLCATPGLAANLLLPGHDIIIITVTRIIDGVAQWTVIKVYQVTNYIWEE